MVSQMQKNHTFIFHVSVHSLHTTVNLVSLLSVRIEISYH